MRQSSSFPWPPKLTNRLDAGVAPRVCGRRRIENCAGRMGGHSWLVEKCLPTMRQTINEGVRADIQFASSGVEILPAQDGMPTHRTFFPSFPTKVSVL
jgi:hypothetical protein